VSHPVPRRRPGPAPPTALGAPPAPVMGDSTSVPEQALASEQYPGEDPEPLWLRLPAELAAYFDLGFCHTDVICPCIVLRVRDDTTQAPVEVSGPPSAFLGLAQVIAALCEAVPCLLHDARGEAVLGEAG
jgi:hypothetical protein